MLALGAYPEVGLKAARDRREDARKQLAAGQDPSVERKVRKLTRVNTFGALVREWLEKHRSKFTQSTFEKAQWMLEELLFPYIGARPIDSIKAADLLPALCKIEARGRHETAHRAKWRAGEVFRYAVATGRAERDPTADLRGALASVRSKKRAALMHAAAPNGVTGTRPPCCASRYTRPSVPACCRRLAVRSRSGFGIRCGQRRASPHRSTEDLKA